MVYDGEQGVNKGLIVASTTPPTTAQISRDPQVTTWDGRGPGGVRGPSQQEGENCQLQLATWCVAVAAVLGDAWCFGLGSVVPIVGSTA